MGDERGRERAMENNKRCENESASEEQMGVLVGMLVVCFGVC